MIPGISTQVFLSQRLHTQHLDALTHGGARAIELRAARWHLDYTDRAQLRDIAAWFRASDVLATLRAPLTADTLYSRHGSTPLNLVHPDRTRRIEAMDEVKRALELAEHFPIRSCVVPLGDRENHWSERVLDFSLAAVEHLNAFAGPLGLRLLLENQHHDIATPEHLLEILRVGHFTTCGICLNVAQAQLSEPGLSKTLELLRDRIAQLHVSNVSPSSNDGKTDTHLWPACEGDRPTWAPAGVLDWHQTWLLLSTLPPETLTILEVAEVPGTTPQQVTRMLQQTLAQARRITDET